MLNTRLMVQTKNARMKRPDNPYARLWRTFLISDPDLRDSPEAFILQPLPPMLSLVDQQAIAPYEGTVCTRKAGQFLHEIETTAANSHRSQRCFGKY